MGAGEDTRRERRIALFRQVAAERVAKLNLLWIEIERRAGDPALFLREAHTLKGEASLTGFALVARLVHAVEDEVKRVRDHGSLPAASDGDRILSGLELVRRLAQGAPEEASAEADTFLTQAGSGAGVPQSATAPDAAATTAERSLEDGARAGVAVARSPSSIRVTAEKIDHLRSMVSDLLLSHVRWRSLARATRQLRESVEAVRPQRKPGAETNELDTWSTLATALSDLESRLRDETHALERFVGDLDGTTRDLRMIPLATLLDRFPVPLRQLARSLGRQIRFRTVGEQTEVDKALLEMLEEPLLHLLRNAIDHGVEAPAERTAAGKPAEAFVRIAAGLVGQRLHLEVSDDGRGIDVESVRRRAVAKGLLDPRTAAVATERDILRTIFTAGFSTRERVSEISGRGIGLNIVLDVVENVGGKVEVRTEPGRGTTFAIDVPLTVAITRVVLFRVGMGDYALPAASVRSLVEAGTQALSDGADGPTITYAGMAVPLLDLGEVLDEPPPAVAPTRIIIAQSGADLVALAGTEGHLEREVMLKPMGKLFERLPLVPAAVDVEGGALALVLKVAELVLLARSRSRRRQERSRADDSRAPGRVALVADDSAVVRDVVAQALRAHGLQVLVASDGEEALGMLEVQARVDVVVTDIEMPRLDGLALVRTLRGRARSRDLPVVAISMRGGELERQAALAAGVSVYLDKGELSQALLWQTIRPLVAGS